MNITKLVDYSNPRSYASCLRKRRAHHLDQLVKGLYKKYGRCRILDLGGTHSYWNIFPETWFSELGVKITLLNLDKAELPEKSYGVFTSIAGDACNLSSFKDNEFDLVHSNSVIEHVGGWDRMSAMAHESRRVGKVVYLQTPYYWFPIEPHFLTPFIHWLPLSIRVWLACRFVLGNWPRASSIDEAVKAQQSAMLLDRRMTQALFPDAKVSFERFLGVPKSLIAIRSETT